MSSRSYGVAWAATVLLVAGVGSGCGEPFASGALAPGGGGGAAGGGAATGGSAGAAPVGGAGGGTATGGSGGDGASSGGSVSACGTFPPFDVGFENDLTTPLGTWVDESMGGELSYPSDFHLAGTGSLLMMETDTSHNAYRRVVVSVDLSGQTVDALRIFNIATATVPSDTSNWAASYTAIGLADGDSEASLYYTTYNRPYAIEASPDVRDNEATAAGVVTDANGHTWYEYCVAVPESMNHDAIRLSLIAEADGGDLAVASAVYSYWDVVQISP